jgi:hypothetical protein
VAPARETEAEAEGEVVAAGQEEKADSDDRDRRDREVERVVVPREPDERDSDDVRGAKQVDRIADRPGPVAVRVSITLVYPTGRRSKTAPTMAARPLSSVGRAPPW